MSTPNPNTASRAAQAEEIAERLQASMGDEVAADIRQAIVRALLETWDGPI